MSLELFLVVFWSVKLEELKKKKTTTTTTTMATKMQWLVKRKKQFLCQHYYSHPQIETEVEKEEDVENENQRKELLRDAAASPTLEDGSFPSSPPALQSTPSGCLPSSLALCSAVTFIIEIKKIFSYQNEYSVRKSQLKNSASKNASFSGLRRNKIASGSFGVLFSYRLLTNILFWQCSRGPTRGRRCGTALTGPCMCPSWCISTRRRSVLTATPSSGEWASSRGTAAATAITRCTASVTLPFYPLPPPPQFLRSFSRPHHRPVLLQPLLRHLRR